MEIINKYRLEIIVFVCGFCGMVLELVGSRVVSPYYGNSLYVWTSLIGVILGALSLGYSIGGRLADKDHSLKLLSKIILLSAVLVGLTAFFKEPVLGVISSSFKTQVELGILISIFLLFGPASILLGIVSPFCAKIKISKLNKSGSVVGNLYALSTVGSIMGTFVGGFYLVPSFGNTLILHLIAFTLLFVSLITYLGKDSLKPVVVSLSLLLSFYFSGEVMRFLKIDAVADIDSQYARIIVKDTSYKGKMVRYMMTDNFGWQSAIYLDGTDDLVFEYTQAYRLVNELNAPVSKVLMIGGAGLTYPRDFVKRNQTATIDVVDIDPKMFEVARDFFWHKDDSRINLIAEDARTYVNQHEGVYDAIMLDAFSGVTPPSHLTTKEFMDSIYQKLSPNGVLMVNIVSSLRGEKARFFEAELNTLGKVFSVIAIYPLDKRNVFEIQNIFVAAYKNPLIEPKAIKNPALASLFSSKFYLDGQLGKKSILTDDHAPVEYLIGRL